MTILSLYEHLPPPPSKKHNPDALTIAQNELGTAFNRERMTLHGIPIKLPELMKMVNRNRKEAGLPQVLYNPIWEYRG